MTDFTWYGKSSYTPPNYNAVDFSFVANNEGAIAIAGTSATAFAPIVTTDIACQGATNFGGYAYGTAECSSTIAGSGSTDLHVYANLDTETNVAGSVSSQSFPTQTFGCGTFSEYQHNGVLTSVAQAFGAAGSAVQGSAATLFEPYYAFTIPGISSLAMGFSGVADGSMYLLGEASEANHVQTVMATAAWSVGRSIEDCQAARLKPTSMAVDGSTTDSISAGRVYPANTSIDGLAAASIGLGARFDSILSASGYATLTPETASYHVSSLAIHANGEIVGYLGGIVASPFGSPSSSAVAVAIDRMLQGLLSAYGLTESISFGSSSRIQATRYEVSYVLIENESIVASTDKPEANVLISVEPVYFTAREEPVSVFIYDEEIRVVKNL